jgi:hypothetical protein
MNCMEICGRNGFSMLLNGFRAIADRPPIGFCNEPLMGSKYGQI